MNQGRPACASPPNSARMGALLQYLLPVLLFLSLVLGVTDLRIGADYWPSPDAIEYALVAKRLASLDAPRLAIGPHDYPTRYALAYPLLLAAPALVPLGDLAARLACFNLLVGVLSVVMMARVGAWLLRSRVGGLIAATLWASHPAVIFWSGVVMSDIAVVAMFLLLLELARPWLMGMPRRAGIGRAALLGGLAAWLVIAKAPFAYWIPAIAALLGIGSPPGCRARPTISFLVACGLLLAADQFYRRWAFGGWGRNGYVYWVPEVYGELRRTFNWSHLLAPHDAGAPRGNLAHYARMLLGTAPMFWGKILGGAALLASLGLAFSGARQALRRPFQPAFLAGCLLAAWGGLGVVFCLLYFFQSERFPLLWWPLLDFALAWGVARVAGMFGRRRAHAAVLLLLALVLLQLRHLYWNRDYLHPIRRGEPYARVIRQALAGLPADAWLFTNYELPLVQALREGREHRRTAALYLFPAADRWFNGHLRQIESLGLASTAHTARAAGDWPDAWVTGPPALLDARAQCHLSDGEFARVFSRPAYALVVSPGNFPATREFSRDRVLPVLRSRLAVVPILERGDVALYRLELPEGRAGASGAGTAPAGAGATPAAKAEAPRSRD